MTTDLPPSIRHLGQKMAIRTPLVITRSNPLQHYPHLHGALTNVTIEATVLLKDLLDPTQSDAIYFALEKIESLCMTHVFGSPILAFDFDEVLEELFNFLKSLSKLQYLTIDTFVRPHAGHRLRATQAPLTVRELTIRDTHGPSLSFLLSSIQASSLTLDSCRFTDPLPTCANLTLENIEAFAGLNEVLSEWRGDHLAIRSSAFLSETFIQDHVQRMHDTGKRFWSGAEEISFEQYPYAVTRSVHELLDLRSRLAM